MADRVVDSRFPDRMRGLLEARGVSYRVLAGRTFHSKSYLYDLATGRKVPTPEVARRIDDALEAGGALVALVRVVPSTAAGDEIDAMELGRRVAASDLSAETLQRLEDAVDELASRYASTAPDLLLPQVRQHLAYVGRLVEVRKTLGQHRRLLVAGGWLSVLGATIHIDLHQRAAGRASLRAAAELADHVEHAEIHGWVLETRHGMRLPPATIGALWSSRSRRRRWPRTAVPPTSRPRRRKGGRGRGWVMLAGPATL